MTRRLPLHFSPRALVTAGALLAATLAATLLGHGELKYGIGLIAALVFVPFAFANPPLAVASWLVANLLAGLPGFGSAANYSVYIVALVTIGAVAAVGTVEDEAAASDVSRLRRREVTLFLLFLLWVTFTLVWAPESGLASDTINRLLRSAVVFFAVLVLVREPKHLRWLAAAFVAGTVLSILSGVASGGLGASTSDEGRLRGGTSDPNYLAAAIVPALMFTGALLSLRLRPLLRAALGVGAIVLAIGLAATESRGGFLALIVVSIVAFATWPGRRATIAMFVAFFALGAAAFFIASPSSWERVTQNKDSGSGRSDIWQVAWRVVEDHPVAGAGLAQFPAVSPDFLRRPGSLSRADLLVDQRIVVHNAYLQLWAETGIVGLLLFLGIAGTSMAASLGAARRYEGIGDEDMATLSRAAMLALLGSLAASFFLSNIDDQRLWVLIAFGPALLAAAERAQRASVR